MKNQFNSVFAVLLFAFLCIHDTYAQDNLAYSASNIPADLLKNADAIYRVKSSDFEIKSVGRGVYKVREVITILNERAAHLANFSVFYDEIKKVRFHGGYIYDKNGKLLKKIKDKDIIDVKAVSNGTLFDDSRNMYYSCLYEDFPLTVEYKYETVYDGLLYIPSQYPIEGYNVAVEHFDFDLKVPDRIGVRFKEIRLPSKVKVLKNENSTNYSWKFEHLRAFGEEAFSNIIDIIPIIKLAPNEFEIEGYRGSQVNWKDFGLWSYELARGQQKLPKKTIEKVKELTDGLKTDIEKAKVLYEYMQDKTRYVGVQLGIGGWKPFSATTVDKYAYGDCKALTNYTQSLFDAAGVKSYYTRVFSGENFIPLDKEFPSQQFNHVFLTLPLQEDTIWLECTSQSAPFGYQGTFTDDRDVLMITENGGEIIHTRKYTEDENVLTSNCDIELSLDRNPSAIKIERNYKGVFYDQVSFYLTARDDELREMFQRKFDLGSYNKIVDYNYAETRARVPSIKENLSLAAQNLTKSVGGRFIFTPNALSRETKPPKSVEGRVAPFNIQRSKTWVDTIRYGVPNGYKLAHIPEEYSLSSPFGSYQTKVTEEDGKIIYIRKRIEFKGAHPPAMYNEFYKYCQSISKQDNMKLVLLEY